MAETLPHVLARRRTAGLVGLRRTTRPCDAVAGAEGVRTTHMLRATRYDPRYNHAIGTTQPYRGTDHTVETMIRLAKGDVDPQALVGSALRGERSINVRRHTEQIIGGVRPKDYASEIIAIGKWWGNAMRYTRDPVHVEMLRDPDRLVQDALTGRLAGDCFPGDTWLLRDDYNLVPISSIEPGQQIWGFDRWSTVQAVWPKGELEVDAIGLNTGSWVHLTSDHQVYIVTPHGQVERIRVADLRVGQQLLSPERIPFGSLEQDPDLAYLDGVYLSDGWHDDYAISISGQDGCPKEAQKREVEKIAAKHGLNTSWYRKHIRVFGKEIAERGLMMGTHAPVKKALTIDLAEAAAAELLRGIMADSGINSALGAGNKSISRTFSSTSLMLAIQTRLLHKMFGVRMSMRRVDDHGGLGTNPIYRLGQRLADRWHPVRVRSIERNVRSTECYDITTDDHKVYLPAHDVTVSNCDEFACAIGTSCLTVGAPIQFVTVGFQPHVPGTQKIHTHVFVRAQDPRTKVWWVLDPVAGRRVQQMLSRVRQYSLFEVD